MKPEGPPHDLASYLLGIPVYVSPYIGKVVKQFQTRRHRKVRVDKKWRKRYGMTTIREPTAYQMNRLFTGLHRDVIVMNREMIKKTVDAIDRTKPENYPGFKP